VTFANLFLVYIYLKRLVKNIVIKIQNQVTQHFLLENHYSYPVETSRNMAKKAGNYNCCSIRITGSAVLVGEGVCEQLLIIYENLFRYSVVFIFYQSIVNPTFYLYTLPCKLIIDQLLMAALHSLFFEAFFTAAPCIWGR
jgi:hypothetical protein